MAKLFRNMNLVALLIIAGIALIVMFHFRPDPNYLYFKDLAFGLAAAIGLWHVFAKHSGGAWSRKELAGIVAWGILLISSVAAQNPMVMRYFSPYQREVAYAQTLVALIAAVPVLFKGRPWKRLAGT